MGRLGQNWGVFSVDDTDYDLSHLHQFNISIDAGVDQKFGIAITFDDHCFTREWSEADDEKWIYPNCSRSKGVFCLERYNLSLNIRSFLIDIDKIPSWVLNGENFALLPSVNQNGQKYAYGIIYSLDPVSGFNDVVLHMRVRTAFCYESDLPDTFGLIKFVNLIKLRMQRKQPNKKMDKRRKRPRIL